MSVEAVSRHDVTSPPIFSRKSPFISTVLLTTKRYVHVDLFVREMQINSAPVTRGCSGRVHTLSPCNMSITAGSFFAPTTNSASDSSPSPLTSSARKIRRATFSAVSRSPRPCRQWMDCDRTTLLL